MSEESIKTPSTPDDSFAPKKIYNYRKISLKFIGNCLRQKIVYVLFTEM